MNGTLILNDLTVYGLRRMHVIEIGRRVETDGWMEEVPVQAQESLTVVRQQREDGLDEHHAWFLWHAREAVELMMPDGSKQMGVMWWLGKDGDPRRIQDALDYFEMVYEYPGEILTADWIPDKFVVVVAKEADCGA